MFSKKFPISIFLFFFPQLFRYFGRPKIKPLKSFEQVLENINKMFGKVNIPNTNFDYMNGIWFHENNRRVTVISDISELDANNIDQVPLLGVYDQTNNQLIIFPDAINEISNRYSDYKSLHIENGKVISDSRNTNGAAINAERTGLWPDQAFNQVELIVKIYILLLKIIHNNYGKWISAFYSDKNKHFIDLLVYQLLKRIIQDDQELRDCFEWLNMRPVKLDSPEKESFNIISPIEFIMNSAATTEEEWVILSSLDIFINCFPINKKKVNISWTEFLDKTISESQSELITLVKNHGSGWEVIDKYLDENNKIKFKSVLTSIRFGLNDSYKNKWWYLWN